MSAGIGIFQGEAPQFIVLAISIAYQSYVHHFNTEVQADIDTFTNSVRHSVPEEPRNGFFRFIINHSMLMFLFCTLVIVARIIIYHFMSSGMLVFMDLFILVYFLFISIYLFLCHKNRHNWKTEQLNHPMPKVPSPLARTVNSNPAPPPSSSQPGPPPPLQS